MIKQNCQPCQRLIGSHPKARAGTIHPRRDPPDFAVAGRALRHGVLTAEPFGVYLAVQGLADANIADRCTCMGKSPSRSSGADTRLMGRSSPTVGAPIREMQRCSTSRLFCAILCARHSRCSRGETLLGLKIKSSVFREADKKAVDREKDEPRGNLGLVRRSRHVIRRGSRDSLMSGSLRGGEELCVSDVGGASASIIYSYVIS